VIRVVIKLIHYPQGDQDRDSHTHSQTTDINERVYLVFNEISPRDLEIAFDHTRWFYSNSEKTHGNMRRLHVV
jgi:hypothetical protein